MRNEAPLTTGDGDAEWHEERRPIAGTWVCGMCFTRHPDPPEGYSMCCSCGTIDLETKKPRTTLRPMSGRSENAVKCPACLAPPGEGCDGPRSHPSRIEAYQALLQETIELHTPRLSRLILKPGMNEVVIRGCSCGFVIEGVEGVRAFADHVHWPVGAVHALTNLAGLLYDVLDYYPDEVNRSQVIKALGAYLAVRP